MKMPSILIGMPVGGHTVPWGTVVSLVNTIRVCDRAGVKVEVSNVVGCSVVTIARSLIVREFLASEHTHLFWIDGDMEWTPEDFLKLLGYAALLPVVGASYARKKEDTDFIMARLGAEGEYEMNGLGCVKVRGMGLGFTVVQRAVLERLAERAPKVRLEGAELADIFRVDRLDGEIRGEDLAFFDDCRELGYDVWLDPRPILGHIGFKTYRADVAESLGLTDHLKELPTCKTPSNEST